jgi:hypothetical protein
MAANRSLLAVALLTLLLAACRKAEIVSYRAPKDLEAEPPPTTATTPPASVEAAAAPSMAAAPVATDEGPGLVWTAPADWQAVPAAPMRKATYAVPGENGAKADLSITAFPNSVGGEIANVNRWRGQLQLPPLSETEVASVVSRFERNGLKFAVVDFVSTGTANRQRMLGAIVPVDGATWFFKLLGPDAVVTRATPAFEAFLQTVKPSSPVAP